MCYLSPWTAFRHIRNVYSTCINFDMAWPFLNILASKHSTCIAAILSIHHSPPPHHNWCIDVTTSSILSGVQKERLKPGKFVAICRALEFVSAFALLEIPTEEESLSVPKQS